MAELIESNIVVNPLAIGVAFIYIYVARKHLRGTFIEKWVSWILIVGGVLCYATNNTGLGFILHGVYIFKILAFANWKKMIRSVVSWFM